MFTNSFSESGSKLYRPLDSMTGTNFSFSQIVNLTKYSNYSKGEIEATLNNFTGNTLIIQV